MAAITAKMVKELREKTQLGMLDCKKALVEADGDLNRAIEILREKGLSAVAKKSDRIAAEGLVHTIITNDEKIGVIVEINSETDFVAKNEEFQKYVDQVANHIVKTVSEDIDTLLVDKWIHDETVNVQEALSQKIAVIGENLKIRRFHKIEKSDDTLLVSYIHAGGKVAVLLELKTTDFNDKVAEAGKNIAMQIAAMNPLYINRSEVSQEFIDSELEILKQQALNEGKPANIVEKMVQGRLNKNLKELCLEDQSYIKDDELTVSGYLKAVSKEAGSDISVKSFVRYAVGEGIEKKEENFADEVNKAIQG